MFYVYMLQSAHQKNWLYVGYSDNLRVRIKQHNRGRVKSTRAYMPLRLVYYEAYITELDARRREYELKHNHQQKEQLKKRLGIVLM